jgi:hypothetical protein
MPFSLNWRYGFPDDVGAEVFVREFRMAVAPNDRAYLMTRPPLFILGVGDEDTGDGETYESRVGRVVDELQQALDHGGKLVPYAVVDAGVTAGVKAEVLAGQAGDRLGFGIPRHMTPGRFPRFLLLRDAVDAVVDRAAGGGPEPGAKALRDFMYGRRVVRGGLPGWLWSTGGGDMWVAGGWLVSRVRQPLTQTFPRWCWARRWTYQRLAPQPVQRWLGAEQNVRPGREDLFQVLDDLSQYQVPRLERPAGDAQRAQVLFALERLLLRALLEDLSDPPAGGLLPERRRRTARPVLLVPIPQDTPAHEEARRRAERFLAAFHDAQQTAYAPGPLVIAVGRPSDELLARMGPVREASLVQAAQLLRDGGEGPPVLVPLTNASFGRTGRIIEEVWPRTFRIGWRIKPRPTGVKADMRASEAEGGRGIAMEQDTESDGRRRRRALVVVGLGVAVMLAAGSIGVRELLDSFQAHGRLGPSDTPAVVTTIVALTTATGTLIGVILTAYAKYVHAKGQADADVIRARAELIRAEADAARVRAGLPAVESGTSHSPPSVNASDHL